MKTPNLDTFDAKLNQLTKLQKSTQRQVDELKEIVNNLREDLAMHKSNPIKHSTVQQKEKAVEPYNVFYEILKCDRSGLDYLFVGGILPDDQVKKLTDLSFKVIILDDLPNKITIISWCER